MAVPYTFGSATSSIPLSQLDTNFATTITLGNTAIQLGNTVTTLNNMTLANVSVTQATFTSNVVVSVTDNTNAALRITQLGTGNALLVEDSANPDSSPFVIDATGAAILGTTASATLGLTGQQLQVQTVAAISGAGALFAGWNATQPNAINLARSQSGTIGTNGVVSSGAASSIRFFFDDGTNFIRGAAIEAAVDGTPGTNDMPGRLVFSTTADGASSPTERMRINSAGNVGIGTTTITNTNLRLSKNITGSTTSFGLLSDGIAQSDSTSEARGVASAIGTQDTAFTVGNLSQFYASQGTFGASSTVTNQFGFVANSTLTGATNNYGFYGNIAAASGRYNFYAAGTADNYFAGDVGIGTTTPVTKLEVAGSNNSTWSVTASISTTTMDVTAVGSGTIAVGDLVYGVGVQPYTRVTALGTGTGGTGTYTVSVSQTLASGTVVGGATYGNTLIRITETDSAVSAQQPTGALQFYTSDASAPTAGVGAYVAAVSEDTSPDTALVFGTRDDAGGGIDANERMRIDSSGNVGIGTITPGAKLEVAGNAIISVTDNTNAALRITQLGTGNALLVEDDTNPDSTPFVIEASGNLIKGRTSQVAFSGTTPGTLIANSVGAAANLGQLYYANNSSGAFFLLGKSRGSSGAPFTTVSSGDTLGTVQFEGADGTGLIVGALISAAVDGTPGTNDMPGRLVFSTTADGASSSTERVRIDSVGNVGIGVTPTAVLNLKAGTATASTSPLKFTSGTNLTSVEAGAVEYDGNVFYGTADVTSGRGLWPTIQYFRLTADGSAITTIANFFGGTSGITLDTSAFYEVEYNLFFTKTTAGTATFTMTFANAPINNDAWYVGTPVGGVGTAGTAQTAAIVKSTATAGALPATGTLTTAVNHRYTVKAMFQANATTGGTLNLQATSSAGSITPLTGSYYKITRLPAVNTGAFV